MWFCFWLAVGSALFPAGSTAGTIDLPAGFNEVLVASDIESPTAMAFAPDGRLFVCQQNGQLRVVKDGALLSLPFLSVPTDPTGERGLLGVAFDPGFTTNGFVYVYYTVPSSPPHNRVSRFTAAGDFAAPGSELVVLDLDELSVTSANHNGGALRFGTDGKLYIAVGDNARSFKAQALDNLLGKMLRINPDGTIPADNPYYGTAAGVNRAIWAIGLRNPFTFAVQPGTGRMFINDVGEISWEEINEGMPGANFGWPDFEGRDNTGTSDNPLLAYGHGVGEDEGCAITGGTFYNPATPQFPSAYVGKYFFADFCGGWIHVIDPEDPEVVEDFAHGVAAPVGLEVGPDGALYFLSRSGGKLFKIQASSSPGIVVPPGNQIVPPGAAAAFSVAASGAEPLVYQWQCNGTNVPAATNALFNLPTVSPAAHGDLFSVVVANGFGSVTSNPAMLLISTNPPPAAVINLPATGTRYRAGDTIHFAGLGLSGSGEPLAVEACMWTVVFHHAQHTHPFYGPIVGVTNGTFIIPTSGESASDVFYRVHLTVTNAEGMSHSTSVDVTPITSTVTLVTLPPGLRVTLGGQPVVTPLTFTGVVGLARSLGVVSPQAAAGTNYGFLKWSDGGASTHGIITPESNMTFTASFIADNAPPELRLARAGNELVLSWPAISTGYVVQATHTLEPSVQWSPATNVVTRGDAWCGASADILNGNRFYRLVGTNPPSPRLRVSRSGPSLFLQWPTQAVGYVLQTTPALAAAASWQAATNLISASNDQFTAVADASIGQAFFRLVAPKLETPSLNLTLTGTTLYLRWPTSAASYTLESTPSLTPAVPWYLLSNPITLLDGQQQVLLPLPPGNQFFRLLKP